MHRWFAALTLLITSCLPASAQWWQEFYYNLNYADVSSGRVLPFPAALASLQSGCVGSWQGGLVSTGGFLSIGLNVGVLEIGPSAYPPPHTPNQAVIIAIEGRCNGNLVYRTEWWICCEDYCVVRPRVPHALRGKCRGAGCVKGVGGIRG